MITSEKTNFKNISSEAPDSALAAKDESQFRYAQLAREITSGGLKFGDKLQPVRKLSSEWGMSFEGVRQVLSRLESAGLVMRRQGSGTYVSRRGEAGAQNKSSSGFVLLLMDAYGHIYRNIAELLIGNIQDDGYNCVKYSRDEMNPGVVPESVLRSVNNWSKNPPSAVVAHFVDTRLYSILDRLESGGTKIIRLFGESSLMPQWHYVGSDIAMQAELAAEWAVARGHKRIGIVTHKRHINEHDPSSHQKRTVGHTPLIVALGRELRARLNKKGGLTILYNIPNKTGSDPLSPENIKKAAKWLSSPNRPTAVLGGDFRLVGICKAAELIGLRIPEDLELLGIGNTPWSKAYEFSSISLNEKLIADKIAEVIKEPCNKINKIIVPPDFPSEK